MLTRAEFGIDSKVTFKNGKKFINAVVVSLNLNPIDSIIEYRLFYREGTDGGKRARCYATVTPYFIKESKHFRG